MSRAVSRIFSLLLAVCLMLGTVCAAFAAEPVLPLGTSTSLGDSDGFGSDPNTVYTQEELIAWLAANQSGTVSLGCSITVTTRIYLDNPVAIDTGAYGLVFDKELLIDLNGLSQITGEGVNMPVLEIIGTKLIRGGDWNNILQRLSVIATGREGEGGTALRISAPNVGALDGLNIQMYEPGKIRSYGTGAIGVELAVPFDVYGFDVAVEGENSAAVYAHAGGSVHFCRLSAVGGEAVRSESGEFAVHGCAASPSVEREGVTVTAAALSDYPIYIPVKQNSDWDDLYYHIYRYCYTVTLKETSANSGLSTLFVDYDMDVLDEIDMSEPGITMIPGILGTEYFSDWFANLLSGLDWPAYLMVDVRDPVVPCISGVTFYASNGIPVVQLNMWELPQELLERRILWRSDDGGETWYDCTNDPQVRWRKNILGSEFLNQVQIELSCINEGTIFQVEIPDVGESNLVTFTFVDGKAGGGPGGDRTGTDRVIGAKPGPAKPDPDPDPDDGNGLGGEGDLDGENQGGKPDDGDNNTGGPGETPGNDGGNEGESTGDGGGNDGDDDTGAAPGDDPDADDEIPGSGNGGESSGGNGDSGSGNTDRDAGGSSDTDSQRVASSTAVDPKIPVSVNLSGNTSGIAAAGEMNRPVAPDGIHTADTGDHASEQKQPDAQPAEKEEVPPHMTIADETIPTEDLPLPQPALPEPGTGSGVILAVSAAAAILAAGGYIGLGRWKTRIKR